MRPVQRARHVPLLAAGHLVLLVAGCGSSPESARDGSLDDVSAPDAQDTQNIPACSSKPTTGEFPSDVARVLTAKCQTCHSRPPVNHAPFPLLTYEDTLQIDTLPVYSGEPIWRVMHQVIQPDGVPHMPFGGAPQLTSAELQTLDGWLLACAPPVFASSGDDMGEGGDGDSGPTSDAVVE
jgi:hypothetical protein